MTDFHCQFCGLVPDPGQSVCSNREMSENACPNEVNDLMVGGPLNGLRRGHYRAIVADPPWSFLTRSDKGKDRSPEQHYDCMTLDEIKTMPVKEIAAKDCVLVMWIIDTHLQMALDVIDAWGFTFKTKAFTWVKTNKTPGEALDPSSYFTGMGFWTRANPEDALLATTGSPKRNDGGKGVRRLIVAPRREHSRKPDEVLERVETLVPGPYCELFSRTTRPGWDAMGNEVGKFDNGGLGQTVDYNNVEPLTADEMDLLDAALVSADDDFGDLI